MKLLNTVMFALLAALSIVLIYGLLFDGKTNFKIKPGCASIKETRIVKMTGHLNYDQCYVITADADENVLLHTILCEDTLKFKGK